MKPHFFIILGALLIAVSSISYWGSSAPQQVQRVRPYAHIDWSDAPSPAPERIEKGDKVTYRGVTKEYLNYFFKKIGYTAKEAQKGASEIVPRVYLINIKKDWAQGESVALKKSLFYRVLLPLILRNNEEVLEERRRLLELEAKSLESLKKSDREWLSELARNYRALKEDETLTAAVIPELLLRVDVIPPSLALGQAAYESGYGTSRFAHAGNALYGQWTWGGGIKPTNQRKGKGDYGIKAFDSPMESVKGYALNINSHPSYSALRKKRSELRGKKQGAVDINSLALADTLTSYSERGAAYVKSLKGIINANNLTLADSLRLKDMKPIYFEGKGVG